MKKWLEKIKKIKHWEIYAAVLAVVLIVGIYLSTLAPKKTTPATTTNNEVVPNLNQSYADYLGSKLENVLGSVAGAGKVAVLVMTDGEGTAELAYDIQEKTVTQTGTNGQEITTTTKDQKLLTNNGQPIILWTNPPAILGIVVVATGAGDVSVRLHLLRAVQTIIGNQKVDIEILTGN